MDMDTILELTWVPMIAFGICLGYAVVLLSTKNPKMLLSKKKPVMVKNETKYAVEGGKLLLFMAAGSLLMCGLLLVNLTAALIEIVAWIFVFGYQWKKISDQYGPIQ